MARRCLLLITTQYPPELGGMSLFLGPLATGFALRGWETLVIARKAPGSAQSDPPAPAGTRPNAVYRYARIPVWDFLSVFVKGLWTIWRKRPAFVLIGHWYPHAIVAFGWRVLTGTPYFIIVHGNELFPYSPNPVKHLIKRVVMKGLPSFLSRADGLLANSEYTRALVQRVTGIQGDRIAILHPPVRREFFEPVSEEEQLQIRRRHSLLGKRVILTVGHLETYKGAHRVLEALTSILEAEPTAHYLIVGSGPEREALERQVAALGLQAAVSFAGAVPNDELPAYYAVADVFAMISSGVPEKTELEGFGIVYLEAASSGKPVVAGTHGGVSEAVLEGVTGLLVDPEDREAIAQSVTSLLTNREAAQAMGSAGRERALALFTPEAIAGDALSAIARYLREPGLAELD